MPDKHIDVEAETRTLSLCLFDVAGITVLNRCSNCPGAARAPIQHRRCPREHLQPNIYCPDDADSKIGAALKSLASSSKQHESLNHETDTVPPPLARLSLVDSAGTAKQHKSLNHEIDTVLPSFARLSLVDSVGTAGTFGQSNSDPDIPGERAELSGTPSIPHGVKRKAKVEDRVESSSLAKSRYKKKEFDHLSVPDYLKLPKPLRDLDFGNLVVPGCWHIPSDEMTALNSSAATPMDTQEVCPSGDASCARPFVAGFCINTELDGCGLLACNDGIACLDEMEF